MWYVFTLYHNHYIVYIQTYVYCIYIELYDNYRNLKYKFNCSYHLKYIACVDCLHSLYPFEFNLNHQ